MDEKTQPFHDPCVNPGDLPAGFPPVFGAFLLFGPLPLPEGQLLLFLAEGFRGEFAAPVDAVFSQDPPQVVEPDLFFVSKDRLSLTTEKNIQGVPDLFVEIRSPTTSLRDRREKFALYERFGVPEYWIVGPERNTVSVFRLSGGRYAEALEFGFGERLETPLLPGLSILLSEVFPS